jgi:hypothetical protein
MDGNGSATSSSRPRRLALGQGWQPVTLPEGTQCDTRMHLNRDQVAKLMTVLQ